ncbi:ADP-ribosylglycohydrolase family protein [Alphaproteobacteria bacterium]|nr:ADP-ribosylglycohydrolase family protein [Alphaproteobacteria bacterium]
MKLDYLKNIKIVLNGFKAGDKNGGPTELAKILSESLIASDGFNHSDLVARYYHWWNTDAFDTGPTFAMVFLKVSQGIPIEDASIEVNKALNGATAGCGPAHRIAPLAAFKNIPTSKLVDYARLEALITHYHPDAGNCSGVMALLCRYLFEGYSWDKSKDLVSKDEDVKAIWIKIQNAKLNNGGYVLDVMYSAFHFLDREDALNSSLKFAGPANYCPVIVGVLQEIIDHNNN